jgi:hypothetical protein
LKELADSLGNPENTITSYQEVLRTAMAAHARSPEAESTRAVIEAYQQLGQIESFSGYLKDARDLYQRCDHPSRTRVGSGRGWERI